MILHYKEREEYGKLQRSLAGIEPKTNKNNEPKTEY